MLLDRAFGKGWCFFGITEIPDHDDPSKVYLKRWRLIELPRWFGVKLHHICLSDNPETRGLHDHPWPFLSIRLRGRYDELRPGSQFDNLSTACLEADEGFFLGLYRYHKHRFINIVRSTDLHAVRLYDEDRGCWTLVLNGRRCREWGFRFPGQLWTPWHQLDGPHAYNVRGKAGSVK